MELWSTDKEEVALLKERVDEAGRVAANQLKEDGLEGGKGHKRRREDIGSRNDQDRDDDTVQEGMLVKRKKPKGRR
jgi:ATP-dependent RNA helicase DDX47/RRP3